MTPRQQREARAIVQAFLVYCVESPCGHFDYQTRTLHDRARLFLRQTEAPKKPARRKP